MADNSLKISYKIYLEAEDISQSRISSTASYVELHQFLFTESGSGQ